MQCTQANKCAMTTVSTSAGGAAIMGGCQAHLPEQGGVAHNMPQRQAEALHDAEDAVALFQRDQPPRIRHLRSRTTHLSSSFIIIVQAFSPEDAGGAKVAQDGKAYA